MLIIKFKPVAKKKMR